MSATKRHARTKRELLIESWERLDCESVGAKELEKIQQAIFRELGEGGIESPASIARTLADEGAVLRHPEVLECDAHWREKQSRMSHIPDSLRVGTLREAAEAIKGIEISRRKLDAHSDQTGLRLLDEAVVRAREDRLLVARSKVVDEKARAEAREIAEWLGVWLRSPELFDDWLDLRRRSADFLNHFPEID